MPKIRVLVIEDDAALLSVVCRLLTECGDYEPRAAADGLEGLELLKDGGYGLVITDVLMPGQDGIETIGRIRELNRTIPIIAMSGYDIGEFSPLKDASLMGADFTLEKPFGAEELLAAVRRVLHQEPRGQATGS